jgi:DNA topoisomerase-1
MTKLRYVSTDEPGYCRKKRGRGFTYYDTQGEIIHDPDMREWIESIVIPPAWTNVWISPYQNAHILATGRDDKGRKQYRYHPHWQEVHGEKKFDELYEFGQHLPGIRETTENHLRQHKLSREHVLAAVVRLLENTLIRIGNEEYTRNNDSHGLTTLRDDHAEIQGREITFDFVGKSGKEQTVVLKDRRLARIVKRCQDIPGYQLFQYYDENGQTHVVDSADVNAYLKEITGKLFTAKVFRTWGGSTLAAKYLCEQDAERGEAAIKDCVDLVAKALGNTKAICRKYYIHPVIISAYLEGDLPDVCEASQAQPTSDYALVPEELTLMRLIDQRK